MASAQFDAALTCDGEQIGSKPVDRSLVRAKLIAAIAASMAIRNLSQVRTARLLRTDQPTLSKVLRGRSESVSLDKLVAWLLALGRSVEIRIDHTELSGEGKFTAVVGGRVNVE
jgi:predicted XRE-type DNA-binding protein